MNHTNDPSGNYQPLLPAVVQPKGVEFFLRTWTGRIIILNTLVFLITLWKSQTFGLFSVDLDVLIELGAKDPVRLAQGEYWRLVTPMFIHGGILHFAFNNWALYVLGYQIEHLLKASRYLLLYLVAGIAGNLASAFWSVAISVGASGALFGLLGCGFYFERSIRSRLEQLTGSKLQRGVYSGMVVANVLLGLIIPQIDNAAHLGGLIAGISFSYVLLRVRPNRLLRQDPYKAWIVALVVSVVFLGAGAIASSPKWVQGRLSAAVQSAVGSEEKIFYLGRLLTLDPENGGARLHRLALALQSGKFDLASVDFEALRIAGGYTTSLREMSMEFRRLGLFEASEWLDIRLQSKVHSL